MKRSKFILKKERDIWICYKWVSFILNGAENKYKELFSIWGTLLVFFISVAYIAPTYCAAPYRDCHHTYWGPCPQRGSQSNSPTSDKGTKANFIGHQLTYH